ncbi:MAG: preprotein translocase subunit YajC [Propionibacteriales bacterium]|nr:preprotein translocase subunit YajC [Propionibacteriales bacterium]
MNPAVSYVVFMVALVALWFVLTRNARAQRRQIAEFQQEIGIGDEVIITAGIFGTVRSVDDDRVQLEIAEGTVITVARQVVVRPVPTEGPEAGSAGRASTDEHHPED